MKRWETLSIAVLSVLGLGVPWALQSCAGSQAAQTTTLTVADLVNEVAHRGDTIYGVTVEECHQAELGASKAPDLRSAQTLVSTIRAKCHVAFDALETVRVSINTLDEAVEKAGKGQITAADLSSAMLTARKLWDDTVKLETETRDFLKGVAQ